MIASPSVNSVIYRFANDVGHALILNGTYRSQGISLLGGQADGHRLDGFHDANLSAPSTQETRGDP